jgi:NAD(P)-dependent dehydrogenase (short-subunit alcohol dehydrogenase family)
MAFTIDPELFGIVDNVALVTGGGGLGMGGTHAVQLARAGCHVVVADMDEEAGRRTVAEIERLGRRAVFVRANVRQASDVRAMVGAAIDEFGRLDIAVNHAGGMGKWSGYIPTLDVEEDVWDDVIELNLKSTLLCCQAEALAMIEHDVRGRIVNMASSSGMIPAPGIAAYGVAKAGIIHLTKTLAIELAPYGIRVNCIAPSRQVAARMMPEAEAEFEQAQYLEAAAQAVPLRRLGQPRDAANIVLFLASELSSYMTGHTLLADGGLTHTTARAPRGMDAKPKALERLGK